MATIKFICGNIVSVTIQTIPKDVHVPTFFAAFGKLLHVHEAVVDPYTGANMHNAAMILLMVHSANVEAACTLWNIMNDQKAGVFSPTSVYIQNLPKNVTKLDLYERFAKYGAISNVNVPLCGSCKVGGIGFVNFLDFTGASNAVADNPLDVKFQMQKYVVDRNGVGYQVG